ncbi:MAG: flagellin lysine-N-methylase [Oscillospiraceae bacterium]
MEFVFPDYYEKFHCVAGACRHSCCIGWEIDIDPAAAAFYDTVPGQLGRRLRSSISREGEPHFILGPGERCPFLNGQNLCELILGLGEEHLCAICADHPRFRNRLPGRVETGLGLCCEEAARLILGKKEPVVLLVSGESEGEDEIVALRDRAIALLQDRSRSIGARVEAMLALCGAERPERRPEAWRALFLGLERLDEAWTGILALLGGPVDLAGFDAYMAGRQTEYEQLLVYLVYRHLANASDGAELAARAAFAALGYELLHALGAALWAKNGAFPFEDQVELARLFSSEIEYSDENLDILLEELAL